MSEIKVIHDEITGEKYNYIKHSSGLDILVWEMEGFSSTEALFGTKYGSINTMFKTEDDENYTAVPEGIAHFLEHKLFENEDTDVFDLYAKTGASANAYTSFDKTCYLFSCSDNYQESLKILLSFVQKPYFTKESVDKEQGIIGQEIKMTEDNPGWRVFFNLLKCLYHNHPVKIDIAGTVESIAKIDADLLYKCYGTFYNLHNMVLSIAGNVKTDEVIKIADELLIPTKDKKLETVFEEEPYGIVQKEVVQKMPVGTPIFHIGFKSNALIGYEGLKAEMEAYVAVNVIADAFSELYKELMDDGLVNNSFSTEVFNGDGYFTVIFAGESKDPREVLNRIKMAINKAKKDGLNREHFDVIKKATYGSTIREFNNVDSVANLLINNYFSNLSPFDGVKILSQMTYEDVQSCLVERFDTENVAISIIES